MTATAPVSVLTRDDFVHLFRLAKTGYLPPVAYGRFRDGTAVPFGDNLFADVRAIAGPDSALGQLASICGWDGLQKLLPKIAGLRPEQARSEIQLLREPLRLACHLVEQAAHVADDHSPYIVLDGRPCRVRPAGHVPSHRLTSSPTTNSCAPGG